ncbi:MAG: nickel-dependent hydrogenase large subunit [Sulfurospirillaceae bacterium]|nr:nickel-dependent hydrogenase large subunit [Sulfurospirillaceae bacterium]MDD2826260.1 nickel-dependent hydrogenase large subunit [Sulfurospirillaceae bacterium]
MKKITKEIIERIEGEATLELEWEDEKIRFAKIKFMNFRGIEQILVNRPIHDAIAITPRVCGICSSSHALAATLAIEDCFAQEGEVLNITQKAKDIREIVLNAEKIQNHIKWFYFSILPELKKMAEVPFNDAFKDKEWLEAQRMVMESLKISAIFSGQWPHGSFLMSGGVTCDPLSSDVINAQNCLETIIRFCERSLLGCPLEEFLSYDSAIQIMGSRSQLSSAIDVMMHFGFDSCGRSYDRFLALGDSYMYEGGLKSAKTTVMSADVKYVNESLENTFFESPTRGYTYSKSALYKKNYFEVGPLARMMVSKDPLIRDLHRRYKDSTLTRVTARLCECAHLLKRTAFLLEHLNLKEASFIPPKYNLNYLTCKGTGIVEASRGSLIHEVSIKNGHITHYDIITPTVWNLGNGDHENPSIAQKAIIGLESIQQADFIFKSFDVCSVCTTQ